MKEADLANFMSIKLPKKEVSMEDLMKSSKSLLAEATDLKKVKAKTDSGHSVGGAGSRGRGGGGGGSSSGHGGVKKQGSNAQRFQRASVLKHGNGQGRTGAVKDHSWVAPVSKTRKKKRKEISKGMKSFRKGGGFKGGNKAKSAPAKFTKKTW